MRKSISAIDELSDRDYELFQNSVHLLVTGSFVIRGIEEHKKYYQFIISNLKLVEAYLECVGWFLRLDESIGIISWAGPPSTRIGFGIEETISLLVFRLLYEEKRHDISLGKFPVINVRDFLEKFNIVSRRTLKKTRFRDILRRFHSLKLVRINGDETDPESTLLLLPSIPFALDGQAIDEIAGRISMLDADAADAGDGQTEQFEEND